MFPQKIVPEIPQSLPSFEATFWMYLRQCTWHGFTYAFRQFQEFKTSGTLKDIVLGWVVCKCRLNPCEHIWQNFATIGKFLIPWTKDNLKVCLVFGKFLRLLWQISYWAIGIVSIFGEISPLWQHFKSLWHLYMSLFCIEENFETYLAICL